MQNALIDTKPLWVGQIENKTPLVLGILLGTHLNCVWVSAWVEEGTNDNGD